MIAFEASIDLKTSQRIMLMLSDKIKKNLKTVVRYSALEVHQGARDKCPVVTGNLRDSIDIKYMFEDPNYAAFIGTNVEYAADQEYNDWYDHFANPKQVNRNAQFGFFRTTLAEVDPKFRERVAHVLGGLE